MDKLCYFDSKSSSMAVGKGDKVKTKKKKSSSSFKTQAAQIAGIAGLNLSGNSASGGNGCNSASSSSVAKTATRISAGEMLSKIQRDVNGSSDEDLTVRKQSLKKLKATLFDDFSLTDADYGEVFGEICKPLFLRFSDPAEKCRDTTLRIVDNFFARSAEVMSVLGYFMPALMKRLPPGLAFDEDMKVFVHDLETHEAFRRGKAVDRQDRDGVTGAIHTTIVEESEELRLLMVKTLQTLLTSLIEKDALSIMNPYFHDCVMFVQAHLRDPFSEVKVVACEILTVMAQQQEIELGMKFFAVALVRACLPVLRHRHAKVRAAAITALHYCMVVKDRAKVKGAGTDAMFDLVGFREENVLPIAAFYKSEVQINYLAELISDTSAAVRERIGHMLFAFLTEMGDRYDHQQRLIPYLLDLVSDETTDVANVALKTLFRCGQQYEEEHHDDIIEKRQYGVDGDERINLDKPLPAPFKERPRIGVRLYVRGNTKRFLSALVNELTNWISKTRLKSALLLKHIVFLCEEHLVMEAHTLFPSYIKALVFAKNDKDRELYNVLIEVFEMAGRFTPVEVYSRYVLPRLRGDPDVVPFGVDSATREAALEFLGALLDGSKASQLPEFFVELATTLSDGFVLPVESEMVRLAALKVILVLLEKVRGVGAGTGLKKVIEAAFLKTGRLNMNDLENSLDSMFRALLEDLQYPSMRADGGKALLLLAQVDADIHPQTTTAPLGGARRLETGNPVGALFARRGPALLQTLAGDIADGIKDGNVATQEMALLQRMATCPYDVVGSNVDIFDKYTTFLLDGAVEASSQSDRGTLLELAELTVSHLSTSADTTSEFDGLFQWPKVLKTSADAVPPRSNNMDVRGRISADKVIDAYVRNVAFEGTAVLKQVRVDVLKALISREDLRSDITTKHLVAMLHALIPSVTTSTNSVALRSSSMDGIEVLVDQLIGAEDDAPKVVAFNKRTAEQTAAFLPIADFLVSLCDVLNDTSDALRRRALLVLQKCIALVPTPECFSTTLDRLLSAAMNADEEEDKDFLDETDALLHGLAVLDPTQTEAVARRFVRNDTDAEDGTGAGTGGGKKTGRAASKVDFLSGLIGHCDLLESLSGLKK